MKNEKIFRLILASVMLALCLVLPFITGQIRQIGNMLAPMHLPVLICGYFCGPIYALFVGLAAPVLRFLLFGMPPLFPRGIAMCFELATYGLVSGLLYKIFPKKNIYIYFSLISAMISGRVVWGLVRAFIAGVSGTKFGIEAFVAGAFTEAIPGIVIQLLLVPFLVILLKKYTDHR